MSGPTPEAEANPMAVSVGDINLATSANCNTRSIYKGQAGLSNEKSVGEKPNCPVPRHGVG